LTRGWRPGPDQLSRYENGSITPSADAVVKLVEVFDVSTDYLLVEDQPSGRFRGRGRFGAQLTTCTQPFAC